MAKPVSDKSQRSDWFFLGRDFAVRISVETVQAIYTLFQNGRHLNILLFLFKLALDASFLSLKFKRIFYLERGNKGQFVSA